MNNADDEHMDQALDEALRETFPASDPVAIIISQAPALPESARICTIGHSNRPLAAFLDLLRENAITQVVDVRTVPRSRHNPQFGQDRLPASLRAAGISYIHLPALGGLRRPRADSPNGGWRNASFRGYADYMQTDAFNDEVDRLARRARSERCVLMCAEAVPWRCHRSLIADALLVRGVRVEHIVGPNRRQVHALTPFGRVAGMRITYPPP